VLASATEPLIELVLDRPPDDQFRAESRQLGQHLLRIVDEPLRQQLVVSACIYADGGTVRLTA
jgi:hypothetical protein